MKHRIELKAMPAFAKTQHLFYSGLLIYFLLFLVVITWMHFLLCILFTAGSRLLEIMAGDFSQLLRKMPGCGLWKATFKVTFCSDHLIPSAMHIKHTCVYLCCVEVQNASLVSVKIILSLLMSVLVPHMYAELLATFKTAPHQSHGNWEKWRWLMLYALPTENHILSCSTHNRNTTFPIKRSHLS